MVGVCVNTIKGGKQMIKLAISAVSILEISFVLFLKINVVDIMYYALLTAIKRTLVPYIGELAEPK